jgi:hypothetical protein
MPGNGLESNVLSLKSKVQQVRNAERGVRSHVARGAVIPR